MPKQKQYQVGDEIEAMCNKCKDATVHVIEVIKEDEVKRVLCKSCQASHKFKSPEEAKAAAKKKAAKKSSASAKTKEQRKRIRVMNKTEEQEYREYDMTNSYAVNDVIIHSKFGEGVVIEVINPLKVSVAFEDHVRTMIQNYN